MTDKTTTTTDDGQRLKCSKCGLTTTSVAEFADPDNHRPTDLDDGPTEVKAQ